MLSPEISNIWRSAKALTRKQRQHDSKIFKVDLTFFCADLDRSQLENRLLFFFTLVTLFIMQSFDIYNFFPPTQEDALYDFYFPLTQLCRLENRQFLIVACTFLESFLYTRTKHICLLSRELDIMKVGCYHTTTMCGQQLLFWLLSTHTTVSS